MTRAYRGFQEMLIEETDEGEVGRPVGKLEIGPDYDLIQALGDWYKPYMSFPYERASILDSAISATTGWRHEYLVRLRDRQPVAPTVADWLDGISREISTGEKQ